MAQDMYRGGPDTLSNKPGYTIEIDKPNAFLEITMFGNWDLALAERYILEREVALTKVQDSGKAAGVIRVLIDCSAAGVQSRPVTVRLEEMGKQHTDTSFKVAVIVSSALHRLQVRRTIRKGLHEFFESRDAARHWLFN